MRWKLRYEQYKKSFDHLDKALADPSDDYVHRAGIIQLFEVTFELAWKTIKDYLNEAGYDVKSPRDSIKTAFKNGYLEDGHIWLEALKSRNLMAHTYDESFIIKAEQQIRNDYAKILRDFYASFG